MKINSLILLFLLSLISCKTKEEMMSNYVLCARNQVGKTYLEELNSKGPKVFSNAGLIWYCRAQAGLSTSSTIYVSWKDVKKPKVGANVYAIKTFNGASVSADLLGVIVSVNPTMVVAGDPEKGILTKHLLEFKKDYLWIEYQYVDF